MEQELQQLERRIQEQIQHFQRQQLQQLSYQEAAATTVAFTSFDRSQIPNVPLQALQPHLDAWFREAEKSKHQHIEQLRKLEKLRDARENLHTLGEQHAQRLRYAEEVQAETRKLQSSWQEWLQELGLGPHLSTDALLETILVIEQAQEGLRQLHKMASKLDIITGNVHSFEETVSTLLDLPPSYHDCLFALKRWKEAEQGQLGLIAEQKQNEQLHLEAEQALLLPSNMRVEHRLVFNSSCRKLLPVDGEQLRILEREQLERKKLDDERMVLEASLESLLSRSLLASFMELLDSQGEEDLALLTATLQEKLTETITQTNELREVIGKLTGQIEKLEQGAEAANQRLQAESIRTTLSQHVNQYAVASFAALL